MEGGVCECGELMTSGETSFSKNLRRMKGLPEHECEGCKIFSNMGTYGGEGLHILYYAATQKERRSITDLWYLVKAHLVRSCQHRCLTILKKVTGLVKKGGAYVDTNWEMLCYCEVLGGYRELKGAEGIEEEARRWLETEHSNGGDIFCEACYLYEMCQEWELMMNKEWTNPKEVLTMDEWLENGAWMRGKSGTGGGELMCT